MPAHIASYKRCLKSWRDLFVLWFSFYFSPLIVAVRAVGKNGKAKLTDEEVLYQKLTKKHTQDSPFVEMLRSSRKMGEKWRRCAFSVSKINPTQHAVSENYFRKCS